jgi:hypothetical protein
MVKILAMIDLNSCVVCPTFHTIAHVVKKSNDADCVSEFLLPNWYSGARYKCMLSASRDDEGQSHRLGTSACLANCFNIHKNI